MIGLEYLLAGHLLVAAADLQCPAEGSPRVSVTSADTSVQYNHNKSRNQLDNFKYDTVSPYGKSARVHVGGLMAGEVRIEQNMQFSQNLYRRQDAGCLSIKSVSVKITIRPTIYVAREYPRSSCMYGAILEHEKKHLMVDQEMVAKYKPKIEVAVERAIKEIGATHGPYSIDRMSAQQDNLLMRVQKVISGINKDMTAERQKRQQAIDTLEEYKRVEALCRGKT